MEDHRSQSDLSGGASRGAGGSGGGGVASPSHSNDKWSTARRPSSPPRGRERDRTPTRMNGDSTAIINNRDRPRSREQDLNGRGFRRRSSLGDSRLLDVRYNGTGSSHSRELDFLPAERARDARGNGINSSDRQSSSHTPPPYNREPRDRDRELLPIADDWTPRNSHANNNSVTTSSSANNSNNHYHLHNHGLHTDDRAAPRDRRSDPFFASEPSSPYSKRMKPSPDDMVDRRSVLSVYRGDIRASDSRDPRDLPPLYSTYPTASSFGSFLEPYYANFSRLSGDAAAALHFEELYRRSALDPFDLPSLGMSREVFPGYYLSNASGGSSRLSLPSSSLDDSKHRSNTRDLSDVRDRSSASHRVRRGDLDFPSRSVERDRVGRDQHYDHDRDRDRSTRLLAPSSSAMNRTDRDRDRDYRDQRDRDRTTGSLNAPSSSASSSSSLALSYSTASTKSTNPALVGPVQITIVDSDIAPKSEAPKNDYCQHFVDTGERPQNFIRDADATDRFTEYPKLHELMRLKNELIKERATPPMYIKADLKAFDLTSLGTKFDVIYMDPPWPEYRRRCPGALNANIQDVWNPEEIMNLRIDLIANSPSFLFLWVGSEEGLEWGRTLFQRWNFRRSEDIAWLKSNKNSPEDNSLKFNQNTVVQHTTEHCLMGIKGTVRRSSDGHIIHANVDTDIIISEQPDYGSVRKPEEMYEIIERFCLGRRRLELFGEDHNIRPGWVTIGKDLPTSNFDKSRYCAFFEGPNGHLLGNTDRIEQLRPKSPPRAEGRGGRGRGGRGRRGGAGKNGSSRGVSSQPRK